LAAGRRHGHHRGVLLRTLSPWSAYAAWLATWAKHVVRWLSQHTGVPALLVAAVLVALGYRILKKTLRFVIEVALVAAVLVALTYAGWIRW